MCFGKDRPFLVLHRGHIDSLTMNRIYSTKPVGSLKEDFDLPWLRSQKICNGNPTTPLKLEVLNYKSDGNHKPYGECMLTINEILGGNLEYPLFSGGKQSKSKVVLAEHEFKAKPQIGEFIRSGWQINL